MGSLLEGVGETGEEAGQLGAVALVPVGEGVGDEVDAALALGRQSLTAGVGEVEDLGPAVRGVGLALEEPALGEGGDATAHGRGVQPLGIGQLAGAGAAVGVQADEDGEVRTGQAAA